MEDEHYRGNRAQLLEQVLSTHLRRRFAVELGGPYTDDRTGSDAYVKRIDERFLAAERKIVDSLIGDLLATGPEGAYRALTVVFDAAVEHAQRRAKFLQKNSTASTST